MMTKMLPVEGAHDLVCVSLPPWEKNEISGWSESGSFPRLVCQDQKQPIRSILVVFHAFFLVTTVGSGETKTRIFVSPDLAE